VANLKSGRERAASTAAGDVTRNGVNYHVIHTIHRLCCCISMPPPSPRISLHVRRNVCKLASCLHHLLLYPS